ncbi:DNA repair protein complementing XP-G cells homolog isoform X2 [Cottoperca gobio]|uniref:DNA repair protein complementing XP-G cells homolog isoform X2 n=1 Tax=Cottoperca gobio TaxID=56716 RepID=A0A6J2RML2_COTGO|nr:DNA repair protein complementing XP-G cells isoform X2 [Cottoperca gobio]
MGVHGLWRLLESTGKPINPETLEGKILAVDISIWLNQAVKGVRDHEGNSVQNAHLLTLFNRICKLLFFRIRPVFVFDGDAPLLKKQTLALRRQRKEELSRESKQTNEKLLKTFLKRQAIKAALGDKSKDPLPSLSTVRRDEVDDIYVLPALPAAEEKDKSSSEEEEEEEEKELEETDDGYHMYQGELYENPNSVDINSEEFASLPPEMKHEILKDMKEFSKRRRTMYQKPPERSGDFSQYQLAGLLQRNHLNQRLRGVENEMSQLSAGSAPQIYQHDGDQQSRSVESRRLVSEDNSHYILIKGSKKKETAPESQPATAAWSGSSLTGSKRRVADRPEPLWRPVGEEDAGVLGFSSEDSKPSVSKPSRRDSSPPSPRTLKAIQSAMNDSSDEEKVDQDNKDGGMSPRTLLAIQQALAEEEDGTVISSSSTKPQANVHRPAPQVVISSSEEEPEPDDVNSLPNGKSDFKGNPTGQSLHVKDGLFAGSSGGEIEGVIGQKNKALCFATLQQPHESEMKSEEETKKGQLARDIRTGSRGRDEPERRESEHGLITKPEGAADSNRNTLSSDLSAQLCGKPLTAETEMQPVLLKQRSNKGIVALEEGNGDDVKSERSEESESEESLIEVSDVEYKEEDTDDSLVSTGEKGSPDEVSEDETKQEEKPEEGLTDVPAEKERQTEETATESSSTPAINEWEHFDVDELEALESSLQVEQSNLRQLKQQQERMANTVTGQMHLESQELLRLFGVPFLVAPMEAEAQCAALDRADHTNGTITDDSDVWLFGGRHVYRNFFNQDKYVEHYQYSDMQNQLGLDRTKLINLAYLLGSDYTEGVPGVGYVTGMELLNEFPGPGLEPLTQLSEWWSVAQEKKRLVADPRDTKIKKKLRNLKLHPGFPNPAVAQAYLQPAVDQSDSFFSWGRPQLDMIKEFCLSRFGWSTRRTEETLQPVIKQLNTQQTQLRIDSFFRMEQREKQAIRSQRLRRAVTCLKRKEREGGEEEEDGEEEMPSPSKSKKGKAASKSPKKGGGGGGGGEREEERSAAGGGFLGSKVIVESPLPSLKDVSSTSQESLSVKAVPQSTKTVSQRARSSSSTSQESLSVKAVPQSTKTVSQRARSSSSTSQESLSVKAVPQSTKTVSQRARSSSSTSSSGEDSDGGGVGEVAMVTARSVFEGSRRGHGAKSTRGRGSARGKRRGKKL